MPQHTFIKLTASSFCRVKIKNSIYADRIKILAGNKQSNQLAESEERASGDLGLGLHGVASGSADRRLN
jgi:hypothetical protein